MSAFSEDFLTFLKTNHTTDYYKAISSDVKPETLASIYNNYCKHFEVWIKVPSSIRSYYNGRVPSDIMLLAYEGKTEELRRLAQNPHAFAKTEEDNSSLLPSTEQLMASIYFNELISLGYNQDTAIELSANRSLREYILHKYIDNNLSAEDKLEWMLTRQKDHDVIHNDWVKYQPEKMLLHLFAQYNRGKVSTEEFMPQAADLMKQIETDGRRDLLLAYLKSSPIQAKISTFKEEILDTLSQTILHEIPQEYRDDYLRYTIPLKIQIRKLITKDNNGETQNLSRQVQDIVTQAKENGVGLDFSNYTNDSKYPMSAELRQMFMAACCINNIPYRGQEGENLDLDSHYIKNMPTEIQALISSRDMNLAKENMFRRTGNNTNNITIKSLADEFIISKSHNNSR